MARVRRLLLLTGAIVSIFCVACGAASSGTKITDGDLKIWLNSVSPDGSSRIVIYQHDTGALGYGRVFWAVTPAELTDTDLTKFRLPDGYRAEGWGDSGELKISKWQPYYGIRDGREIRDGDLFNGIKVKMIENNSEYALPGYKEPTSNR